MVKKKISIIKRNNKIGRPKKVVNKKVFIDEENKKSKSNCSRDNDVLFLPDFTLRLYKKKLLKSKSFVEKVRKWVFIDDMMYVVKVNNHRYRFVLLPRYKSLKSTNYVVFDKNKGWKCLCMNFKVNRDYCSHILASKTFFDDEFKSFFKENFIKK